MSDGRLAPRLFEYFDYTGTQAVQMQAAQAGPPGQVASGIAQSGGQATQQRLGRSLDTRPTILVDAGSLCTVLLIKPLSLAAFE